MMKDQRSRTRTKNRGEQRRTGEDRRNQKKENRAEGLGRTNNK